MVANSSYAPANGRGELGVNRGALGSTPAAHDGLTNIIRYAYTGDLTLGASVADASATTITVSSISNLDTGGYMVVGNEIMEVVTFPSSTSCTVNRGAEGTTATAHSDGITVYGISTKAATQTDTARDIDSAEAIILMESAAGIDANDFLKIDNEFFRVTTSETIATGLTTIVLAEEKAAESFDRQDTKIRYLYSQVRLTGHDFLDIGCGNKSDTNFPGTPVNAPAPGNEVTEDFPGRVFYVSTDQDGNLSLIHI